MSQEDNKLKEEMKNMNVGAVKPQVVEDEDEEDPPSGNKTPLLHCKSEAIKMESQLPQAQAVIKKIKDKKVVNRLVKGMMEMTMHRFQHKSHTSLNKKPNNNHKMLDHLKWHHKYIKSSVFIKPLLIHPTWS